MKSLPRFYLHYAFRLNSGVRARMRNWRKLLAIIIAIPLLLVGLVFIALLAVVFIGQPLSKHHLQERQAFFAAEVQKASPDMSPDSAVALFQENKVTLNCSQESADLFRCTGKDTEAYGILPEWRIHFELDFQEGKFVQFNQEALGIGL